MAKIWKPASWMALIVAAAFITSCNRTPAVGGASSYDASDGMPTETTLDSLYTGEESSGMVTSTAPSDSANTPVKTKTTTKPKTTTTTRKDMTSSTFPIRNEKAMNVAAYKKSLTTYNMNAPVYDKVYTEAQKEEQRKRGDKLFEDAISIGGTDTHKLKVEPGIYRLRSGMIPFEYLNHDTLTIDVSGCEFILEGDQPLIKLDGCKDITIQGPATVDREPLPYVQFVIKNFDIAKHEMRVELMPGYDASSIRRSATFLFFNEKGERLAHCFIPSSSFKMIDVSKRLGVFYDVEYLEYMGSDKVLKPGVLGATNVEGAYTRFGGFSNCTRINVLDITYYGGGNLLHESNATGPNVYKRVYNIRKPGTNRLIAGGLGQLQYNAGGPKISNSIFSYTNDDAVDIMSSSFMAYKQESSKVIVVKPIQQPVPAKVGDTLNFFDGKDLTKRGSGKVLKVEVIEDPAMAKAARNVAMSRYEYKDSISESNCVRVTLDTAVSIKEGDCVENYTSYRPTDVEVVDNYFHDIFCRILIHGAKGLRVENNLIERTGLSAIDIDHEQAAWAEGANSDNVVIRGNTIIDSPSGPYMNNGDTFVKSGAISVGISQRANCIPSTETKIFTNILIENNTIKNSMYSGILVKNADNVTVRNNKIYNAATKIGTPNTSISPGTKYYGEQPLAGIYLYACSGLNVSGNTITKGPFCTQDIIKNKCK